MFEKSNSATYTSTNNDGFRTLAKVERKARIASRHEKLVEIAIKHENGTPLSRQENLIEGIQELDAKTGLLVAD